MHVLHFIVINSNDPSEACAEVESRLLENNHTDYDYFTVIGCLPQDGSFYFVEGTEFFWNIEEMNSIQNLNEYCKKNFQINSYISGMAHETMEKYQNGKKVSSEYWRNLARFADYMAKSCEINLQTFDILKDSFFGYEFSCQGVTHFFGEDGQKYVVFADFHV
jgi:hypothetical protein